MERTPLLETGREEEEGVITRSPIATVRSTSATPVRVAIYTRKSVADRNGQEFGSIDAQREAVEAFILSQRGEGWAALPVRYDDDGCTGANTDRPAFQRLLQDVEEKRVDLVAVYKIDRLSRSLTDFARLIELFDQHNVTFIAVTQQFNTASSMGRLTLNILMSFAEFERQVISERTADKMLATRRRGKWTGGPVPLGYDTVNKKLVINQTAAEIVRSAFAAFVKTGSVVRTLEWLKERGHLSKKGKPFDRATLSRTLASPIYAGRIRAGVEVVEGEHEAIVDAATWTKAQAVLDANKKPQKAKRSSETLLGGLLRCGRCGTAMSPAHTKRGNKQYHYYKCQSIEKRGASACPGGRIPAAGIEEIVVDKIKAIGHDPDLVETTVAAAKHRLQQDVSDADRRLANLDARKDDLVARRRTALAGLTGNGRDQRATHEALGVVTAELEEVEGELRGTQNQADALARVQVREDEIRSALSSFSEVWAELFPRERARLVQKLVEEVTYNPESDEVEIRFRPEGFRLIAGEEGP